MSKSYKPVPQKGTIADAVSFGCSEIQTLGEEMREWADNMSANEGLTATDKYQAVEEAADTLENHQDELDVPGDVSEFEVEWTEQHPRRRRHQISRQYRLDNAVAALSAARDVCADLSQDEAYLEEHVEDEERREDVKEGAQTLHDELDNMIGDVEGVEFPGMFG